MRKVILFFVVSSFVIAPALTMADDFHPPEWRGNWSTTTQWWGFSEWTQPGETILPDGPGPLDSGQPGEPYPGGPGYLPSTALMVLPMDEWIDIDPEGSNRQGIWPLSGAIEVIVDNHEPPNPFKWMWVQLTWIEQDPAVPVDTLSIIQNRMAGGPDGPYNHDPVKVLEDNVGVDGWHQTLYEWYIYPNPVDEMFTIAGEINVDQLVIDTWCIPEPNTVISLIGIALAAGLVLLRRK